MQGKYSTVEEKQHDTAEVTAELVQFFDKNKEYALWTSKCLKALPVEENKSKLAGMLVAKYAACSPEERLATDWKNEDLLTLPDSLTGELQETRLSDWATQIRPGPGTQFHKEVLTFAHKCKISQATRSQLEKLADTFQAAARTVWPMATVQLFGSYSLGLNVPGSDIDMVIVNVHLSEDQAINRDNWTQNQKWKEHCLSLLIPLLQALDSHQLLTRDGEIIPATIPLIVCTAPFGEGAEIAIDISIGKKKMEDLADQFAELLKSIPFLAPLVKIVKFILKVWNLNNPKDAGLSSTVTFILCVAYLMGPKKGKRLMKKSHGRRVHSDLEGLDLAAHLLGVLRMFGGGVVQGGAASFNFKEDAINLKQDPLVHRSYSCAVMFNRPKQIKKLFNCMANKLEALLNHPEGQPAAADPQVPLPAILGDLPLLSLLFRQVLAEVPPETQPAQDHTAAAAAGDGQQQPPPQQQQRQQQQPLAEDEPIGLAGMPAKPLEERPAS